jgi:hypothetical protein
LLLPAQVEAYHKDSISGKLQPDIHVRLGRRDDPLLLVYARQFLEHFGYRRAFASSLSFLSAQTLIGLFFLSPPPEQRSPRSASTGGDRPQGPVVRDVRAGDGQGRRAVPPRPRRLGVVEAAPPQFDTARNTQRLIHSMDRQQTPPEAVTERPHASIRSHA